MIPSVVAFVSAKVQLSLRAVRRRGAISPEIPVPRTLRSTSLGA
jgi:hypothetical protein